ncbi:MAG: hypothetical protein MSG64_16650 [Pyrinomonadaceae bacterium MAG19_C2-C3]|nr:hypothetical protein [Pyrinomonadaceae bacterium MAG19_C2-C3]
MSNRFAQVSIAGIALSSTGLPSGTPAKAFIEDGAKFSDVVGSSSIALDGTVYSQIAEQAGRGVAFGVRCDYLGADVARTVRTAVVDAFADGAAVRVTASDAFVEFDVYAIPDFTQGSWITYESFSGQILKGVRFRFLATGEAS